MCAYLRYWKTRRKNTTAQLRREIPRPQLQIHNSRALAHKYIFDHFPLRLKNRSGATT